MIHANPFQARVYEKANTSSEESDGDASLHETASPPTEAVSNEFDYDAAVAAGAANAEAHSVELTDVVPLKWYETKCARTLFYIAGILYMFPWATVFFIVAALTVVDVEHNKNSYHPATHTNRSLQYQHMIQLDPKLYLYWNDPTKTYVDMHLVYYGVGWVAVGVSPETSDTDGPGLLSNRILHGSEAVIGIPLKSPPVQLYEVKSPTFTFDALHLKTKPAQSTVHDTLLVQSSTKTELSFKKDLVGTPKNAISMNPSGVNTLIFAYGATNALGHVLSAGSYTLDFSYYQGTAVDLHDHNTTSSEEESKSGSIINASTNVTNEKLDGGVSDIYVTDTGAINHHNKGTYEHSPCVPSQDPAYQYTLFPTRKKEEAFFSYRVDEVSGRLHGKIAFNQPDRWLAWGISPDGSGSMVGSQVILGFPTTDQQNLVSSINENYAPFFNPGLYNISAMGSSGIVPFDPKLQTLDDAESTIYTGPSTKSTVMTFSKLLQEPNESRPIDPSKPLTIVWAVGKADTMGYHEQRGSFDLILSACDVSIHNDEGGSDKNSGVVSTDMEGLPVSKSDHKVMTLLYTHGVLMTLCFMVVTPISVSCGMLRHMTFLRENWFYLHMSLNILGWCLSTAAFFCALSAINKGGVPHFHNTHQIVGLIIMILVTFQVVGALFRPKRNTSFGKSVGGITPYKSNMGTFSIASKEANDWIGGWLASFNCTKRFIWQKFHEYNGTLILVMGLVQVYDGMEKLQKIYGVTWRITLVFWAFILPWAVLLSILLWIQRGRIERERTMPRSDILPSVGGEDVEDDSINHRVHANVRIV